MMLHKEIIHIINQLQYSYFLFSSEISMKQISKKQQLLYSNLNHYHKKSQNRPKQTVSMNKKQVQEGLLKKTNCYQEQMELGQKIQQFALTMHLLNDIMPQKLPQLVALDYSAAMTANQILVEVSQDKSQQAEILKDRTQKLLRILDYPLGLAKLIISHSEKKINKRQEKPYSRVSEQKHQQNNQNFNTVVPIKYRRISPQQKIKQLTRLQYRRVPESPIEIIQDCRLAKKITSEQEHSRQLMGFEQPVMSIMDQLKQQYDPNTTILEYNKETKKQKNKIISLHRRAKTSQMPFSDANQAEINQRIVTPKIEKINVKPKILVKKMYTEPEFQDNAPQNGIKQSEYNTQQVIQYSKKQQLLKNQMIQTEYIPRYQEHQNKEDRIFSLLRKQFSSICYNNEISVEEKKVTEELRQLEMQLGQIASNSTPRAFKDSRLYQKQQYAGNFSRVSPINCYKLNEEQLQSQRLKKEVVKTVRVSLTPPNKNDKNKKYNSLNCNSKQKASEINYRETKPQSRLLSNRINKVMRC